MEVMTQLQKNAAAETYNDMQLLINKTVWNFYNNYGGSFEEWKAEANLTFVHVFGKHKKSKGQFSTWLYFCIWKSLLTYANILSEQEPKAVSIDNIGEIEDRRNDSFSPLELLEEVQEDTKFLINLIWNPPSQLKKIKTKSGPHPCHKQVVLRNYLLDLGWTGRRVRESFEEITRIIND